MLKWFYLKKKAIVNESRNEPSIFQNSIVFINLDVVLFIIIVLLLGVFYNHYFHSYNQNKLLQFKLKNLRT